MSTNRVLSDEILTNLCSYTLWASGFGNPPSKFGLSVVRWSIRELGTSKVWHSLEVWRISDAVSSRTLEGILRSLLTSTCQEFAIGYFKMAQETCLGS